MTFFSFSKKKNVKLITKMKVFVVACALFSVALAHTVPAGEQSVLKDCFEQDSIACVQQTVRIIHQ